MPGSADQPEQLFGGDDEQSEGQVRGDLDRPANAHVPSAVVVVQV